MDIFGKSFIVFAAVVSISSALSAEPTYTYQIPQLYPTAFDLWDKSLAIHHPSAPEGQRPTITKWDTWLTGLKGVASPITDVSIGNVSYKFGTICVPHACADNIAGILFTPDQTRVIGVVNLDTVPTPLGPMSQQEFRCVQEFVADQGNPASCK